jgi:hypothetical protein
MTVDGDQIALTVEDSFVIAGIGVVVAPSVAVDRLPNRAQLTVDLVDSQGNARRVIGRFETLHFSLVGGGSKWPGRDRSRRWRRSRRTRN